MAKGLAKNRTIRIFDISSLGIGVRGLRYLSDALKGNNVIRTIYLDGNQFGDEGVTSVVELLNANRKIIRLGLCGVGMSDESVKLLSLSLMKPHSLIALMLSRNKIGNSGAFCLATMLKANDEIEMIDIRSNLIGKEGCQYFDEALDVNETLEELKIDDDGSDSQYPYLQIGDIQIQENEKTLKKIEDKLERNRALSSILKSSKKNVGASSLSLAPEPLVMVDDSRDEDDNITDVSIGNDNISQFREFVSLNDSDSASVISRPISVSTLSDFEGRERKRLKKILRYNSELEFHYNKIKKSPEMKRYFWELFFSLDNIVLSLKIINSGYVDGNNTVTTILQVADQVADGVLSCLQVAPGIAILYNIISFVMGEVNDNNIRAFARQISRLFPDSSENGAILKVIVMFLTLSREDEIKRPVSLDSIPAPYSWYLSAMAKLSGRDVIVPIDYLIQQITEQIIKCLKELPGDEVLTVEEWLPSLQTSFNIVIPRSINMSLIGKRILPASGAISAQQILRPKNRVVVTRKEFDALHSRIRELESVQTRAAPAASATTGDWCTVS